LSLVRNGRLYVIYLICLGIRVILTGLGRFLSPVCILLFFFFLLHLHEFSLLLFSLCYLFPDFLKFLFFEIGDFLFGVGVGLVHIQCLSLFRIQLFLIFLLIQLQKFLILFLQSLVLLSYLSFLLFFSASYFFHLLFQLLLQPKFLVLPRLSCEYLDMICSGT
jgi:hypothetical protein